MTGGALAVVALGSAAQIAMYLSDFGTTHRTDGFIAAFAVYSLLVVVAQILRTTAVPLLSGAKPQVSPAAFGWAMALVAVLIAAVCEILAAPLGKLLARSAGQAGAQVAEQSLRVMAPAAGLQLLAVGQAVRGALEGRLVTVALAYMCSAAAGLLAFLLLRGLTAQSVLAWTTLAASAVLVLVMTVTMGIPRPRRQSRRQVFLAVVALIRSVPVPASFVAMYPITLALAPSGQPGRITLFGLAFTACSYLAGFTGQGLSMVDAVALSRLGPEAVAQRRALVTRAFRSSLLVAAPAFAIATVAGQTFVHALIAGSAGRSHESFSVQLLLLAPWTVATLGLWATLPGVLSDRVAAPERWLAGLVAGLLAAHVVACVIGRAIAGFDGLSLAMGAAPLLFVIGAVPRVVAGAGPRLGTDALTISAAAAVSFGAGALLANVVFGSGAGFALLAVALGLAAYGAIVINTYPDVARAVRSTFRGVVSRRALSRP
jgi:hypothetical protein